MPTKCFVPSESGIRRRISSTFGHLVEWFVNQEYCLSKGGCNEFALAGNGTDFFDENSTTTRCRFLAAYLATHNPLLDEGFISGTCGIRKRPVDPDDDENERFAVPDIITHEPGVRMEFYELNIEGGGRDTVSTSRTRLLFGLEDYFGIDPIYRLWIWPAEVRDAVSKLNLTPSPRLVGTD